MKEAIKSTWEKHPLAVIMAAGFLFRLLAIIFSKGYGMHDDHFLVIEPAQKWADGQCDWLPSGGAQGPEGHSLFYWGVHGFLFLFLKWIGMTDPQSKMYIVRAIHALWSMLTIYYGYKIAERFGGRKAANQAGLILALLFFFPMFSVRNLVEMACIPPLVIGTWLMIDPAHKDRLTAYVWSGLLFGISFDIRFQSILFIGGAGLVLLFQREWKKLFTFSLASLIPILSIQLAADMVVWKRPFAEFEQYIMYNVINIHNYPQGGWYAYFLLIGGILIPPVSIFLFFGYMRSWKKFPMLFLPAFIFLLVHSFISNKQERFILPVIPFIIILGSIGWNDYVSSSAFWRSHAKLLKGCWIFFWVLNGIALPVVSTMYSKRSRVESMTWLSKQRDVHGIIIETGNTYNTIQMPLYYINNWKIVIENVNKEHTLQSVYDSYKENPDTLIHPNYVIFLGKDHLPERVDSFRKIFPQTTFCCEISSGFMDKLMEWLNPVNKNQNAYIYRFSESKN